MGYIKSNDYFVYFQFPTSLMRHQLFQQFLYDDNSVVPFLVLEIIEEY